jgi:hypothetical protein
MSLVCEKDLRDHKNTEEEPTGKRYDSEIKTVMITAIILRNTMSLLESGLRKRLIFFFNGAHST